MIFDDIVKKWEDFDVHKYFEKVDDEMVQKSIFSENPDEYDLLNLISPRAVNHIETMAKRAQELKLQHFGNVIGLYMPIYISNYCTNNCAYCGFSKKNRITRRHLELDEIEKEAIEIKKEGVEHILLLTGESPKMVDMEYLKNSVKVLKRHFESVSIEVMPLEENEYKELVDVGVDGLTVYQETYNTKVYDKVHISGKKKDFSFRLNTPERAALAGMRTVGIGPLFGLSEPKKEAFMAGLHLKYLTDKFLNTSFAISLPRINSAEGDFEAKYFLDDVNFVQTLLAYRIFEVKADINISTREIGSFRDKLMHLGITKLSVGSKTDVGGYTDENPSTSQFDISDDRSAKEIIEHIRANGFDPVFKDWHQIA